MVQTSTRFSINITLFLKGCWLAGGGALPQLPLGHKPTRLGAEGGSGDAAPGGLKDKARRSGPCWVSGRDGAGGSPSRPPVLRGTKGDPGARPPTACSHREQMDAGEQTDRQTGRQTAPVFSGRPYHSGAWKGAPTLFLITFARKRPPRGNYATLCREGQRQGKEGLGGPCSVPPSPHGPPSPTDLPQNPRHDEVGPAGPAQTPPHRGYQRPLR